MNIEKRIFNFDKDLDSVRMFLLEIYQKTNSLHYLIPIKIENHKFGPCGPEYSKEDEEDICIWEIKEGNSSTNTKMIAVSHRGSASNYHIEVHPDYKYLENVIFSKIEKLEEKRKVTTNDKARILHYSVGPDQERIETLTELNYLDLGLHEYNYIFPKNETIPEYSLPQGFMVKNLEGEQDYPQFIEVVGTVYQHCGTYMTTEKLKFMTRAEFYHQDLNLVVTAPNGNFIAFCTYRFDPFTKIAELELLGTHPDYKDVNFEYALICEGLVRLMKYDPVMICIVEIDVSDATNKIYESVGFVKTVEMNMWEKKI